MDRTLRAVIAARYLTAAVPEKYKHIDFKPPQSVADEAEKGLEYRQKASPSNRGGLTPAEAAKQGIGSGVQRAVNLKNRDNISPEVIKQMTAFFSRHEKNKGVAPEHKSEPWNDKGNVAWLIWGGDPGRSWAEKIKKQMEAADEKAKKTAARPPVGPKPASPSQISYAKALIEQGIRGLRGIPGWLNPDDAPTDAQLATMDSVSISDLIDSLKSRKPFKVERYGNGAYKIVRKATDHNHQDNTLMTEYQSPIENIEAELVVLESLWSDVQAVLDTYSSVVPMPHVGRIAAADLALHSQTEVFVKCEHAMRHAERVISMCRTQLQIDPGNAEVSSFLRDAQMLYDRFSAGRATARELLSAMNQKIVPAALKGIVAEAVDAVKAVTRFPNSVTVRVRPRMVPIPLNERMVSAQVFDAYVTVYPLPKDDGPDYQQFVFTQATLGDTAVYLTVVDRTNANAPAKSVKVTDGASAARRMLAALRGWSGLFSESLGKTAVAKARKPLTREKVQSMGAAEINKRMDALEDEHFKIVRELIDAGRGRETSMDVARKTDPLSMAFNQVYEDTMLLRREIELRAGPNVKRLPRGFGPRKV